MSADKTIVLVTGANRGIGYEIAAAILRAPAGTSFSAGGPYHVVLTGRSAEKAAAAAKEISSRIPDGSSNSVSYVALDVTNIQTIKHAASQVRQEHGRIDVLINNAGVMSDHDDNPTRLRDILATNVEGAYATTDVFKPLLLTQPAGGKKNKLLLYVSSDLGSLEWLSDPDCKYRHLGHVEYRMSKAAINMLTVCQNIAFEADNVPVLSWSPGYTATTINGDDVQDRLDKGANDPAKISRISYR